MAINITFADYDTVCYSNQHNIIELIKNSVGLSVEVNIGLGQAQQALQQVQDLYDKLYNSGGAGGGGPGDVGALQEIVQHQGGRIGDLEDAVDAIYNNYASFRRSILGEKIQELDDRITALGG